jgi:hypothetical protein
MRMLLAISLIVLGLSFLVSGQEHTNRPPTSTTPTSKPAPSNAVANLDAAGWAKFTSQPGRFSLLIPGTPIEEVKTEPSDHGPYTTHLLILRGDTNVFLVGWVDYDPSFNFNRQSELEMNRDNFVKGVKAQLLTSRTFTVDGYQALEFTAEVPNRIFTSRVYMVGRRPYQLVIGSPKGVDDSANINRFFNSFKVSPN